MRASQTPTCLKERESDIKVLKEGRVSDTNVFKEESDITVFNEDHCTTLVGS